MSDKVKILYRTFSFLVTIFILLAINYFYQFINNYGFLIGVSIAAFINEFWKSPLYIESIKIDSEIIDINYLNPFLKAGKASYKINEVSNFKIVKDNIFRRNGRIEFKHNGLNVDFAYLNSQKKKVFENFENFENQNNLQPNNLDNGL